MRQTQQNIRFDRSLGRRFQRSRLGHGHRRLNGTRRFGSNVQAVSKSIDQNADKVFLAEWWTSVQSCRAALSAPSSTKERRRCSLYAMALRVGTSNVYRGSATPKDCDARPGGRTSSEKRSNKRLARPRDSTFGQRLSATFADPRSDRRLLVTYDVNGSLRRAQEIDVPIGAVYSLPSERRLLLLRRTDTQELVIYEWSWRANQ